MTIMAKVEVPFVQAFKDRHGRLRHYFRRKGHKRVALPGAPGSREFSDAYRAALAADKPSATSTTEGPSVIVGVPAGGVKPL